MEFSPNETARVTQRSSRLWDTSANDRSWQAASEERQKHQTELRAAVSSGRYNFIAILGISHWVEVLAALTS